jgi:TP901 family phage tail tape measure protein
MRGLNQVIDLQKAKLKELQDRQEGLDLSNQKQASQFLKLERQIQQANKQLASYEAQADRARNSMRYQVSGLAALQHSYEQSRQSSAAYVTRLQAEGRTASATVEKYRQLRSSLTNLQDQYRKQEFLLRQVANDTGKNSDAYIKQREQLDKTATSIAKTKDEMQSMQSSINRLQPTGIQRIDDAVVKTRDNASRMTSRLSAGFDNLKNHMMGIAVTATTVGAAVVSSVNKAADVQKVMVENQNLMRTAGERAATTQKEVNQMYADGERYSVQYGESQKTIAQGYQELIKRGYDGQQALGAMKSILEASKASGDSFDDTMKVTTSTLEAFGMRAESTGGMMRNTAKAADTLAKAADVTSTSFKDIGVGMEYAGSSAKQSGVSLRETAAILGVLSNNGLEASQAGTSVQRIFTRLAAPTSTATNALKKYNMSIDDFKDKSGRLESVNTIFKKINANVPKTERLQFFNQVFGQTAQNAAGILSRTAALSDKNSQSLAHVENQLKTAYSEDYVGKLARRNMNSAKNSEDRFKYASQAIQIEIGRNMLPALSKASQSMANAFGRKDTQRGLRVIARGLGTVANALASLVSFIGKHTTTVKVFGTVMLTAFAGVKLLNGIGLLRDSLKNLPMLLRGIGTAAKIATLGFNPWVIAIEAVVAGFTLLYKHSAKFRNFVNGLARDAKKGMSQVGKWFKTTFNNISKWHQQTVRNSQRHNQQAQRNWNNYWRSVQRGWNNYWRQQNRQQQQNQRTQERQEQASQRRRQRAIANFNRTVSRDAQNAWRSMERAAQNGSNRVSRWYDQLNRTTSRSIQNMARNHPRLFNDMYRTIQDRTRVWHDVVTGHWSDLRDDTAKTAQDTSRTNKNIFEDMYSVINQKTDGWLGKVVNSWKDHMSAIGDAIESARKKAGQAMADLANGVLKPFKTLIDDIQGGINWILDKVGASKLGGSWSAAIPTFATGTAGNPDGLKKSTIGMVNDGAGPHWREMYFYKGHVGMFPNKRNFITFLPKGISILNGEDSHKSMNMMGLPHFANGIGDFFSGILSKSEDILENVDKILEHPIEFAKSVFDRFTSHINTGIKFAASLVKGVPPYIARQIGNWIKKQFATLENPGGAGVARWRPYIIRAFKQLGVEPAEWKVAKLLRQIQTESGGNPLAWQGIHDVNSGGNEARGLLQFAGSTWAADALPGHTDWRNGYNEILAAIAVLERGGEGGWGNVGNGHGWANGGLISTHGMYEVGEGNKPEMIIPLSASKRSRAYQLLSEVMAQFKHEDNNGSETHSNGELYDKQDFVNVQRLIDELNNGIKTLISLQQTQIAVTKAQGKFDPHQQYIQQAQALSMKLQQY